MLCVSVERWPEEAGLETLQRAVNQMWRRLRRLLRPGTNGDRNYEPSHQGGTEETVEWQMGSERMEMRKRQLWLQQQDSPAGGAAVAQTDQQGNQRNNNACCFCWCCCCSCSWNEDQDGRNRRGSFDVKTEASTECEERPTLEEVLAWAQSFERLMECSAGRSAFRQFLRTEFSEENILFWMACEEFRQENNRNNIEEKARNIYEDYISILSPREVSLDSRVREVINRNMLEPNCHTFDDAQIQIYTLMQRDSYPRYMNSPAYKNLLNALTEQTPEA